MKLLRVAAILATGLLVVVGLSILPQGIYVTDKYDPVEVAAPGNVTITVTPNTGARVVSRRFLLNHQVAPDDAIFIVEVAGNSNVTIALRAASGEVASKACTDYPTGECGFGLVLSPATISAGIVLEVSDFGSGEKIYSGPVEFKQSRSYSIGWWSGLMGI